MSCWLAALQQRSHLESRLATVGRLYSDITVSESHFHFTVHHGTCNEEITLQSTLVMLVYFSEGMTY